MLLEFYNPELLTGHQNMCPKISQKSYTQRFWKCPEFKDEKKLVTTHARGVEFSLNYNYVVLVLALRTNFP